MQSVADILGPWVDPNFDSGLIKRCRKSWNTPIDKLSNEMLATFLRQDIAAEDIAAEAILEEASKRLAENIDDESEIYDGELAIAVEARMERRVRNAP